MSYPSRHERGYGAAWVKLRTQILRRDDYLCQPCMKAGRTTLAREVDHITPKAKGGQDEPDNLQAICLECHKEKTRAENSERMGGKPRLGFDEKGWPIWPE